MLRDTEQEIQIVEYSQNYNFKVMMNEKVKKAKCEEGQSINQSINTLLT